MALNKILEKLSKDRTAFAKQKAENADALLKYVLIIDEANALKEKKKRMIKLKSRKLDTPK